MFQAVKSSPLLIFETKMEVGLSNEAMNRGLDEFNAEDESDPCNRFEVDMMINR